MPRFLIPLLVAAAALFAAPSTQAAQTDLLWATINICDSPAHPNKLGVRASMPGNGTRQRMYMRFSAWWYSREKKLWSPVTGARSEWIHVGSAIYRTREDGYTFKISPPPTGGEFVVRGVVEFEWRKRRGRGRRKRWVVARRLRATTREGIKDVAEADPPGLSLGVCQIR